MDRAVVSRGGMAEPIPQTAHLDIGCGSVSGDVEHSRDPPERGTSTDSGEIPDANARPCSSGGCTEHLQAGAHPPQSPPPSKGDRTRRPGTTDEQRAKDTESTRASSQENGWKTRLTSTKLTSRNRWLSGALGKTSTCSSNEFFFFPTQRSSRCA